MKQKIAKYYPMGKGRFKHIKKREKNIWSVLLVMLCFACAFKNTSAQTTIIQDSVSNGQYVKVIAGKKYQTSGIHNFLWGKHYRAEWSTPVKIKAVHLDTLMGGLVPFKKGGGRQTKTLRLKDKTGKEYVLRSIDKTFTRALPEVFRGTFVEAVANDQVSIAHPYSAITVPMLAEAAGVYHTNPQIVFVPDQPALDTFRKDFKDQLYLFEERPDGFQGDADNFGNSEDVDGTEKVLKKIKEENDHRVDQVSFIRARLFDMFLSDWGRHEDQWRWATFEENGIKVYRPIPRDRDQAFTKFDGLLVGVGTKAGNLAYLQSVDYTIKNIRGYNFQARHLDRLLANEPTLEVWTSIAKDLQLRLTDNIIIESIKQLPPEVYNLSGPVLTAMLISRRDRLVQFAEEYYAVLAKDVEITGSENKEQFEVTGMGTDTKVEIFDLDSTGAKKEKAFYSRVFHSTETKEIRLYGIGNKDNFVVQGATDNNIETRIIGGLKKDDYKVSDDFKAKLKIYDNKDNNYSITKNTKLKVSDDSTIHAFDYNAFLPDKAKIRVGMSYNNEDRLFVTLGYRLTRQQWRKSPFGYQANFNVNYSITQKAFSFEYNGVYNKALGLWNLGVLALYDGIRDVHFSGIGNNTKLLVSTPNYYRYRNHEANIALSLFRNFGQHHYVSFTGFFDVVSVLQNGDRFINLGFGNTYKSIFTTDKFTGARADYRYTTVNDKYFPTKGITFTSEAEFTHNIYKPKNSVTRFTGTFGFYVPIAKSLTLAIKTGAATLVGHPEFYQLNKLGSGRTIRGFQRFRFYGKSAVYKQNELQYNFNVKSYLFSGKMGLLALLDNGRVWQPGEQSNLWHVGAGGGLMIAPFNKFTLSATYTKSNEDVRFNVRIGKLL
ncbi:MAG: BamA/TamA family outer membrane protein [Chitinophagaceae bacterium]|nr:BamA/TamA family outer membrane protein [Chitinophagaceae bacterium]